MLKRDEWLDLARKLDWSFSYVTEQEVFPQAQSGTPWLCQSAWSDWDEPYRTSYSEYVANQSHKDASVSAVREAVGRLEQTKTLDPGWLNAVKLHVAALTVAEFAAVIANLRGSRLGRDSAWRSTATLGALEATFSLTLPR